MRIIHLASGDLWAGAEVQLFHLAVNLAKQDNVKLLVVLLNEGQLVDELRARHIDVLVINEQKYSFFKIGFEFFKICSEFKPDVIHTHRVKENIIGGVNAWLNRCKSVRTVHGAAEYSTSIKEKSVNFTDDIIACLFQHKVVAVSDELKNKLSSHCFYKKITVIENCVDIEHINSKALDDAHLQIDEECFNVVFVGRFVVVKRVDLFVAVAEDIKKRYSDKKIQFYMLGDGPLWQQTKEFINKQGLSGLIQLVGFVDNSAPIMKQMDLLVVTSDHEGLPMTLLESMVLKVPVLSRDLATIKSVLCQGECGYFMENDDTHAFADKIINIIAEKELRGTKTSAAYDVVINNYSIQVLIERYMTMYHSIL